GPIDIGATLGNVNLTSTITGKAGSGSDFACGDGSELLLFSGKSTTVSGAVDVSGGTQCFGGEISIDARMDFVQNANITSRGPGAFGGGGQFLLGAGRNATLRNIDLTSPGFGGTADVIAT